MYMNYPMIVTTAFLVFFLVTLSGTAQHSDNYNNERIHRTVSDDGTEIAGRVLGQGPPLVLVHGGLGDDSTWESLLPYLTDNYTCYVMSLRGRGLSGEPSEPDYPIERLVEDIVAFAESVGEPVYLMGYSLGGMLAIPVAAQSASIRAVAIYEGPVFDVIGDEQAVRFAESAENAVAAAADGRMADAARSIIEPVANDDELNELSEMGIFDVWAVNVPIAIREMQQAPDPELGGPTPTQPSLLEHIGVPVLYLHASETPTDWYVESAQYLDEHIDNMTVVEIEGVGHFAPHLQPDVVADELIRFFDTVR
jgi:pimeloyl-ACP methyl ester carboxylesterase